MGRKEPQKGAFDRVTRKILNRSLKKISAVYAQAKGGVTIEEAVKNAKYTPKQLYWENMGKSFVEINGSVERQKLFPKLLQSYSPSYERQGITRTQQFIYHIENYLTETYILHQRITTLLNTLKRQAKKAGMPQATADALDKFREFLDGAMNNLIETRGSHTHVKRISTEDLNRLETVELALSRAKTEEDKRKFGIWRNILLRFARYEWKKKIKDNNDNLLQVLDHLFYWLDKSKILDDTAAKTK